MFLWWELDIKYKKVIYRELNRNYTKEYRLGQRNFYDLIHQNLVQRFSNKLPACFVLEDTLK